MPRFEKPVADPHKMELWREEELATIASNSRFFSFQTNGKY